jgi:hypothetical protein
MGGEWFFNTLFSLSDAGALNETYEEYEVETMNFYVNTGSVILPISALMIILHLFSLFILWLVRKFPKNYYLRKSALLMFPFTENILKQF